MTKKMRDIILISILTVILGAVFLVFQLVVFKQESSEASILYRNKEVAVVDFNTQTVKITSNQATINEAIGNLYPEDIFPIWEVKDSNTGVITLMGDYENSLVQITYNFLDKTMQVTKETSPRKVCSYIGASTFQPIECRPNNIRVIFKQQVDNGIDGTI